MLILSTRYTVMATVRLLASGNYTEGERQRVSKYIDDILTWQGRISAKDVFYRELGLYLHCGQ